MLDLWAMLEGEANNGVTINNIFKALLGIQGIDPDFDNPDAKYSIPYEDDKFGGFSKDGDFFFTVNDIKTVFVRFKALYVHKVYKEGQAKRYKTAAA